MRTGRKNEGHGSKPFAGGSEEGDPIEEEEDYADAVNRHATYIGIDPEEDADCMWIAEEALNADIPKGWVTGEGEGEYEGLVYYYNEATGQSTWDHPLDDYYRKLFKKRKAKKDSERSKRKSGKSSRRSSQSRTPPSSSRAKLDTGKQRASDYRDSNRRRSRSRSPRREGMFSRGSEKGGDQAPKQHCTAYSSSRAKDGKTGKGQRDEMKKDLRGQRGGESRNFVPKSTSKERRSRHGRDSPDASENRREASRKGLNSSRRLSAARGDAGATYNPINKERSTSTSERIDDILPSVLSSRSVQSVGDDGKPQGRKGEYSSRKHFLQDTKKEMRQERNRASTRDFERETDKLSGLSSASTTQKGGINISPSASASPPATRSRGWKLHCSRRVYEIGTANDDKSEGQTRRGPSSKSKRERRKTHSGGGSSPSHTMANKLLDYSASEEIMGNNDGYHPGSRAQGNQLEVDFGAELREMENDEEQENHLQKATKSAKSVAERGKHSKMDILVISPKPAKSAHTNTIYSDGREGVGEEYRYSTECCSNTSGKTYESGSRHCRDTSPVDSPLIGNECRDDVVECSSARHNRASHLIDGEKSSGEWPDVSRGGEGSSRYDRPFTGQSVPPQMRMNLDDEINYWPGVTELQDGVFPRNHGSYQELKGRPTAISTDYDRRTCHDEGEEGKRLMDEELVRHEIYHNESDWGLDWDRGSYRGAGKEGKRVDEEESMVRVSRGDRETCQHSGGIGCLDEEGWTEHVGYQRCPEVKVDGEHYDEEIERGRERGRIGREDWKSGKGEAIAGQRKQEEQEEAAERARMVLEEKVSCLEDDLALSKSREDNLRKEVAELTRRDTVMRKLHSKALEEGKGSTAAVEKKLAATISKINQMAEMETSWTETEARLRGEVDFFREKAKTAEDSFARKEAEDKDSSVTNVRARLANAETELQAQGETLHDFQRRYAEASTKVATSVREVNMSKDLVENLRIEIAESTAREAALEEALTQAAREASTVSSELSRVREEVARRDIKVAKVVEEAHGARKELTLAMDRANEMEDRLTREKTSCDSMVEELRARATGLETANASMEREMRHAQQDALSRLRDIESERDAALYEAKRSAERGSAAEAWRLKELNRVETADAASAMIGTEVVELRSDLARLRGAMDAATLSHLKQQAELQEQIEDTGRERAKLVAEYKREKKSHAAEMAAIKDEISSRLPQLADKALAEAERHWRLKVEGERSTAKRARDQRLREMQASLEEAEARRHADTAGARAETERFKNIAEKLAAENRSICGELERIMASSKTPSPFAACRKQEPAHLASMHGAARRDLNDDGLAAANRAVESILHVQVLGQVEAHINSLRSLLDPSSGRSFHEAGQLDTWGYIKPGVGLQHGLSDEERAKSKSDPPLPSSRQSQSNHHLSSGSVKGEGLTEAENMRLDGLLRAMKVWSTNFKKEAKQDAPMDDSRDRSTDRGDSSTRGRSDAGGSGREITCEHRFAAEDSSFDRKPTPQIPEDLSQKLSTLPEVGGSRSARDFLYYDNATDVKCPVCAECGMQDGVSTPRMPKGESGNDLEDISDGGFHSGCWQRKYASGEIR